MPLVTPVRARYTAVPSSSRQAMEHPNERAGGTMAASHSDTGPAAPSRVSGNPVTGGVCASTG